MMSWVMLVAVVAGVVVVGGVFTLLVRPRVTVKLARTVAGPRVRTFRGHCGEAFPLCLRIHMKHLSLRRSAADIVLNIHAISDVRLHVARYGATQEFTSRDVKNGKGPSRSMQVSGVKIDKWEPTPFEDVEVWITVPPAGGKYLAWTTSFPHAGGGGVPASPASCSRSSAANFRIRKVSYVGTWRLRALRWFASPNPYHLPPYPSLMRATWWSEPESVSARPPTPVTVPPTRGRPVTGRRARIRAERPPSKSGTRRGVRDGRFRRMSLLHDQRRDGGRAGQANHHSTLSSRPGRWKCSTRAVVGRPPPVGESES